MADACLESTCETNDDCEIINISIWYPTCNGDVLETPGGSGVNACVDGRCELDMTLEETDCAAEGKTCGPNPEEGVQGDACL